MFTATVEEKEYKIEFDSENSLKGTIDNKDFLLDLVWSKEGVFHLLKDNQSFNIEVVKADLKKKEIQLLINGDEYSVKIKDDTDRLLSEMGLDSFAEVLETEIKAPMPGLVLKVIANVGDIVKKGDILLVLEAMKMENSLKSPREGKIKTVYCTSKQVVEKGAVLIEFE